MFGGYPPTLSLDELAADKLLALFEKTQAGDHVDVEHVGRPVGLDGLCALAGEKDRGASKDALAERLASGNVRSLQRRRPRRG